MTTVRCVILVFSTILFSEVTSWTVDLAEMEKILVKEPVDENINSENENKNDVLYTSNYAENYEYQNFNSKQVENIIKNGGVYLDGLSNALATFRDTLNKCSRNSSKNEEKTNETERIRCEAAMKRKDYVQKLSEIALLTTDKLRDEADKGDLDDGVEENDLLQLAWILDQLAYLTGYGPNHGNHIKIGSEKSPTSTTESTKETTKHSQELEILEQVENGRPLSNLPLKSLKENKVLHEKKITFKDGRFASSFPPKSTTAVKTLQEDESQTKDGRSESKLPPKSISDIKILHKEELMSPKSTTDKKILQNNESETKGSSVLNLPPKSMTDKKILQNTESETKDSNSVFNLPPKTTTDIKTLQNNESETKDSNTVLNLQPKSTTDIKIQEDELKNKDGLSASNLPPKSTTDVKTLQKTESQIKDGRSVSNLPPKSTSDVKNLQTEELIIRDGRSLSKSTTDIKIHEDELKLIDASNLPPKSLTDVKSIQKRDTDDIMRYYLKYKVWNGSNKLVDDHMNYDNEFEVDNSLKVLPIRKRSITYKKASNMRGILHKIRHIQSKLKSRTKNSVRKLVKSIKVYRRKIVNDKH